MPARSLPRWTLALAALASAAAASRADYLLTPLPQGPAGRTYSYSLLNDDGVVAGSYADADGSFGLFRYDGSSFNSVTTAGLYAPSGLSNAGLIVGTNSQGGFVWDGVSDPTQLLGFSSADGVNDSGQIVGVASGTGGPALFQGGTVTDLDPGLGRPAGLSNTGTVIGEGGVSDTTGTPAVPLASLGGPALTGTSARAVNDSGHVVGAAATPNGESLPFFSDGEELRNIAPSEVVRGEARDINNAGRVVGGAFNAVDLEDRAFLYDAATGEWNNLNDLIDEPGDWQLTMGLAINEDGTILAEGRLGGEGGASQQVLLSLSGTPTPPVDPPTPPVVSPPPVVEPEPTEPEPTEPTPTEPEPGEPNIPMTPEPNSPPIDTPEPATLALLGVGAAASRWLIPRRR